MSERIVSDPSQHGWVEEDGKWVWDGQSQSSLWTDEGNGSISYDGTVEVNGQNGVGLRFDMAGSDDYLMSETAAGGVMQFGEGTATAFTHNFSSGTVTVSGDLMAAKPDAGGGAIAIGAAAGGITQAGFALAVGNAAGYTAQGESAVALGHNAGKTNQGEYATAVGSGAGHTEQGGLATALGVNAGENTQGASATAVGWAAGQTNQGDYSIAIGREAGKTDQHANSIIISATGLPSDLSYAGISIAVPNAYLNYNGSDTWEFSGGNVTGGGLSFNSIVQDGSPVIDARGLITTLSTLRNATKDETTLEGMRDALADAIGGLIENLEHEIATMPAEDSE